MRQEIDVLDMVVRLLVALRLLLGLPRVDALQDGQPSELGERDLQPGQRLVARRVHGGIARSPLHARKDQNKLSTTAIATANSRKL